MDSELHIVKCDNKTLLSLDVESHDRKMWEFTPIATGILMYSIGESAYQKNVESRDGRIFYTIEGSIIYLYDNSNKTFYETHVCEGEIDQYLLMRSINFILDGK